jgi:protein YibB
MSKISIVTAFYDIGRGDWSTSTEKNGGPLPHYLQRSVDKYIDHFTRMCEIDTEIIVYTSPDIAPRLAAISPNVKVVEYDYFNIHQELRDKIEAIQTTPEFIKKINPYQVRNPEYWSKDYVGVTSLKAFYVSDAFERGLITNEFAAWVDFGYCRDDQHIPSSKKWEYDFAPGLMHYFNFREPNMRQMKSQISMAVQNNLVFIIGGVFVGQRTEWQQLATEMKEGLEYLMSIGLVDDDQGLLLMAYFRNPDMFELHKMDPNAPIEDVRGILRKFNNYE